MGTIIICLILALVFQDENLIIVQLTIYVSVWINVIMNFFSMRYIRRELSEVEGILVDVKFMALYVGFFCCAALIDTIMMILLHIEWPEGSVSYYRVRIATATLAMLVAVLFFGVHMIMLMMFFKFANKIPSHVKSRLTQNLKETLSVQ